MNPLIGLSTTTTFAALVTFTLCSGGQAVHSYLRSVGNSPDNRPLIIAYEGAILVHLLLMTLFVFEAMQGSSTPVLHLPGFAIPFMPLLWLNAGVVAITVYTTIVSPGEGDVLEQPLSLRWMAPIESALACACLPTSMLVAGEHWIIVLYIDAIYYGFRTTFLLTLGVRIRARTVTQLSVIEALKSMPEGMLYADDEGRTLLANDAMRHCLSALGLPTDFARVDELWHLLEEKASGDNAVDVVRKLQSGNEPWLFLQIAPDEIRLFSFEGPGQRNELRYPSARTLEDDLTYLYAGKGLLGPLPNMRIFAYDVTQEAQTLQAIELANNELAAQQDELRASMETVREAAENEAMLRMRGRVHDIIGQRLSMVHRALEDNAISDEELDRLKPLLKGILDDLAAETTIEPSEELAATVAAFALTGVTVTVEGDLPDDPVRAKVFADCVRESCTNAVKHARSTHVHVSLSPESVSASNDGPLPTLPIHESTGLTNMRRAAASIGATLTIDALEPPFTIRLTMNQRGQAPSTH